METKKKTPQRMKMEAELKVLILQKITEYKAKRAKEKIVQNSQTKNPNEK